MVTSLVLVVIYVLYAISSGIALAVDRSLDGVVGYESYMTAIGPSPSVAALIAICIFVPLFFSFNIARPTYRVYYIQYLLSDFVVLRENERK